MKNFETRTEDISFFAFVAESENPAIGKMYHDSILSLTEKGKLLFFNNLNQVGVYNIISGEIIHRKKSAEIKSRAHKVFLSLEIVKLNSIIEKANEKSFAWVERKVKELIRIAQKKEKLPREVFVCFLERIQFHVSQMKNKERIKLTDYISTKIITNYTKRNELV